MNDAFDDKEFDYAEVPAKMSPAEVMANAREIKTQRPEDREMHVDYSFAGEGVSEPQNGEGHPKREPAWARIMMYLVCQGFSNQEIAEKLHKAVETIRVARRAPWFREQLEAVIEEEGRESFRAILEGEATNSLYTLIEVRDTAEKASDRRAAADSILDRIFGKAAQTNINYEGGKTLPVKERQSLEHQIAMIDKELADRGVSPVTPISANPELLTENGN